jgi:hypothetical protein
MFVIGGGKLETQLLKILADLDDRKNEGIEKIKSYFSLSAEVLELREEKNGLIIDKNLIEEKYEKREREIEHKLGLERTRQEQELKLGLREQTVAIQEKNLVADRKRFEDQMQFHEKRFTEEVSYLKDMIKPLLEALPKMTIKETVRKR